MPQGPDDQAASWVESKPILNSYLTLLRTGSRGETERHAGTHKNIFEVRYNVTVFDVDGFR